MADFLRTNHQLYSKTEPPMDTITQLKSRVHLEENTIVIFCAKRSLALNLYVCVLKCLLCLMLNILRHMIRKCECKERDTVGLHKCLHNRCLNNIKDHNKNKCYAGKEACDGLFSSRNTKEKASSACSAKKTLKDYSNLEPGMSKFHTDFETTDYLCLTNNARYSNSLIFPATSDTRHKDLKIRDSRAQYSTDQCSISGSEEHNAEMKCASEVERTGLENASNNSSTNIDKQERDLKQPSSIVSTSAYESEAGSKYGVHQTERIGENRLHSDSGSIGNASLEIGDTFCWQETDDAASLIANERLENKLKEIFLSANLLNISGKSETASFSQFADTLSNDSDKPIRNNSLKKTHITVQKVLQTNTALANSILAKDLAELFNRESPPKKDQFSTDYANHCCSNALRSTSYTFSDGEKKQCLESSIASDVFSNVCHMKYGEGMNHYFADKKQHTAPKFVCLEGARIVYDTTQLNDEQNFFARTLDKHYNGLDVVSFKGELVRASQNEEMGDQHKPSDADPDTDRRSARESENAGREEGEDESEEEGKGEGKPEGGGEAEGENQEAEGDKRGGGSEQGGEEGEGGEEGAEDSEGNNYVMIMLRGALGPSVDEAVLDTMYVIKRIGEFVKGSVLKEEGEGGGASSEGGAEGKEGGESDEKGANEEGDKEGGAESGKTEGEEGGEERNEAGSEVGGAEDTQSEDLKSETDETEQSVVEDEELPEEEESEVANEDLQDES